MAEAVTTDDEALPAPSGEAEEPPPPAPAARPPSTPEADHRRKFRLVYLLLAGIIGGAAVGLVALLLQPGSEPRGPFSPWEPRSEAAQDRAQEIANFVGGNYRLDESTQLVSVQAAPPRVQDFPLSAVAIFSAPDGSTYSGENIPVFSADDTIVYILCGLGPECAIEQGEPSEERQRLLRRESLELALYTFRYIDGIDNVVAFMPPRTGYRPSYALFFQRPELDDLVDRPLQDTLPEPLPPLANEISPSEAVIIDRLTQPRFFAFQFQQLPNGTVALVLEDPSRAAPPQPTETTPAEGESGTGEDTAPGSGTETSQ
jgi:hypothetical protein